MQEQEKEFISTNQAAKLSQEQAGVRIPEVGQIIVGTGGRDLVIRRVYRGTGGMQKVGTSAGDIWDVLPYGPNTWAVVAIQSAYYKRHQQPIPPAM